MTFQKGHGPVVGADVGPRSPVRAGDFAPSAFGDGGQEGQCGGEWVSPDRVSEGASVFGLKEVDYTGEPSDGVGSVGEVFEGGWATASLAAA